MISKLSISLFFHYVLLGSLAFSYLALDRYLESNVIDDEVKRKVILNYSNFLDDRILIISELIFNNKARRLRKSTYFDKYEKVSRLYKQLILDNDDNTHQRLIDAETLLYDGPGWNKMQQDLVGYDKIDVRRLYINMISQYTYTGCAVICKIKWKFNFDKHSKKYISKLVQPENFTDYLLTYNENAYRLSHEPLSLQFDQKDIDQGYAEVKIKDLKTLDETLDTIIIPKYAFIEL